MTITNSTRSASADINRKMQDEWRALGCTLVDYVSFSLTVNYVVGW